MYPSEERAKCEIKPGVYGTIYQTNNVNQTLRVTKVPSMDMFFSTLILKKIKANDTKLSFLALKINFIDKTLF